MHVDHVTGLDQRIAVTLAGPLPVVGEKHNLALAHARANLQGEHASHDGMNVVAGPGLHRPVGMLVVFDGAAAGEHVFLLANPAPPPLVDSQAVHDSAIGRLLQLQIKRGLHLQAGLVHLLGAEALFQLLPHLLLKPRRHRHLRLGNVQSQRSLSGLLGLLVADDPVLLHLREHQVAPVQRLLRIQQRRVGHRPLGQPGQQRRLGQRQIAGMLAEVILRSSLKAVLAAAQVNLVAIESEDLLLGEGALNLDGEIGLLNFARRGALGGEKEVARQLHGQRGCALGASVAAHIVPCGAGDAQHVDPPMRFEALVFNRDHGLAQHRRKVVVVDHHAPLQRKGADDAALLVVQLRQRRGPIALQVVNLRQIGGVNQR
jgi:hypothetical protein